jgi:two-component system, NarL family, sensor histidine kinase EvgS
MHTHCFSRLIAVWGCLVWLIAISPIAALSAAESTKSTLALSAAENAWLKANPEIPFSYDPQWLPFSYRDTSGSFSGVDAAVLAHIATRLGVKFVPVSANSWPQAYELAREGRALFLTSTAELPERREDFIFTIPYVEFPVAIVARKETRGAQTIEQLRGRRVAVMRDSAPASTLRRNFPWVEIVERDSVEAALQAVLLGEAEAAISNIANTSYVARAGGLDDLKVAGLFPQKLELRLAVRRDQPELHAALNAAIAAITPAERDAIMEPWIRLDFGSVVSWRRVLRWALLALAILVPIIAAVLWHNTRLRRELELRLRLQRELEATRDRLAALNEEKAGLMRMAAHDLRSPLAGLLLGLDMMRLEKAPPADHRRALDRLIAFVHQISHMVRNLLEVQALEAGTRRLRVEPIALDAALQESIATLEPLAQRKAIQIDLNVAMAGLSARADRAALRQITDNLLSNAIKYTPAGSTLTVIVSPGAETGRARFCVRDQGPGVTPEEMPRLFQKYTCLSARPTGGEASTGLGLSIVKELVTRMDGQVWCESEPNQGATFIVELPAV